MLEVYRSVASIPLYGGDEQHATNTWHFRGASLGQSETLDLDAILAALTAAYQVLDAVLPSTIFGTTVTVQHYRMSDPLPRIPARTDTFTISPTNSAAYPSDVVACLSFRGEYVSGETRARRRGRLFFGPLLASTGSAVAGQGVRINTAAVTTLLDVGGAVVGALIGLQVYWVVYSTANAAAYEIVEQWVDNQFDTRRSRDRGTPTRTTEALSQLP